MNRKVSISVQLGLDSKEFSNKVEQIAKEFKPIEVPLKFNAKSGSVEFTVNPEKLNIQASVSKAIALPLNNLVKGFGVELDRSAQKNKPGFLANILNPLKSVFKGSFEGIGRELSFKLGQGVSKSLEKQFSGVIGSSELLGEALTDSAINAVKNSESLKKVTKLIDRDFVVGKGKTVNPIQSLRDFRKSLNDLVGEANSIIEANAIALKTMQIQRDKATSARQNLANSITSYINSETSRDAQATTIFKATKEAQQEKSLQLERIALLKQEIQERIANKSIPANDLKTKKLETELLNSIADLNKLRATIAEAGQRIKQLQNPLSPASVSLEKITPGFAEERSKLEEGLQILKDENQVSASKFEAVIEKNKKDLTQIKQLQSTIEDKFATDKETLENLKKTSKSESALALIDEKINILSKKKVQDLNKINQLNNTTLGKLQKNQAALQSFLKSTNNIQAQTERNAITNLQKRYVESVSPKQEAVKALAKQPQEAKEVKKAEKVVKENIETYQRIIEKVASLSQTNISAKDIPQLIGDSSIIPKRNSAGYDKNSNRIILNKEDFKDLESGKLSEGLVNLISHELRHALQFNFGNNRSGNSVNLLTPNELEQAQIQDLVPNSIRLARRQNPAISEEELKIVKDTEVDAYTFAQRYSQEILEYVKNVNSIPDKISLKLTELQKETSNAYKKQQQELQSIAEKENQKNIQQLTKKQLIQIAKSASLTGYSGKNKAELSDFVLKNISPDDLNFRIPTFSKVNDSIQEEAKGLIALPSDILKEQVRELNKIFQKETTVASKGKDAVALREVLDGIQQARQVYASALAQNLDKESRQALQAAIARLGKQRIAAQSRLAAIDGNTLNASARPGSSGVNQGVDLQFGFFDDLKVEQELQKLRRKLIERQKVVTGKKEVDTSSLDKLIKRLIANSGDVDEQVARLIKKVTGDVENKLITTDIAIRKVTGLARKLEQRQNQINNETVKSAEASFRKAQAALKQIEQATNKEVSVINSRIKAKEQIEQRRLNQRLQKQGIDQTEPVNIQEQIPQGEFNIGKNVNKLAKDFKEFRSNRIKKQSKVLNQQAQAVLVDLGGQIVQGKAAAKEAKVVKDAIAQNQKQLNQILKQVSDARTGKTKLTRGDLEQLAQQADRLSELLTVDGARLSELIPQIEAAKKVSGARQNLRDSSTSSSNLSQKTVSTKEEIKRIEELNQKTRETLQILGQSPPGGGVFEKLNLQLPGLVKNAIALVKGLFAISTIKFVTDILKNIGREAFLTSVRFEALNKTLEIVSGGEKEGARNLTFLSKLSDDLAQPLDVAISGFNKLIAASRQTSLEGAKTREIYQSVAGAARVYGLTGEQLEGTLLAISQIMSKGTVQAEELRGQLGERLPGSFQVAARAMGVTTAELSKMLELGQVSAEEFLPKFAAQLSKETKDGIVGASNTSAASLQRLRNEFTQFSKEIGDQISPAVVAGINLMTGAFKFLRKNSGLVKAAIVVLSVAITAALLPSIKVATVALLTFAQVTLPLVAKSLLAVAAANPVMLAAMAALTVGMLTAEPAARKLANALNGVNEAQLKQVDADISFDSKLNAGLTRLTQQVPLAEEELKKLTAGLADQVRRGKRSASTVGIMVSQLRKFQQIALETAEAQRRLTQSLRESESAFKRSRNSIDVSGLKKQLEVAKLASSGVAGEDKINDAAYQQQFQHNLALSQALNQRMNIIKASLKESQRLQEAGRKGIDAKEELKLREELRNLEKEDLQIRINLSNQSAQRQKELRERNSRHYNQLLEIQNDYLTQGQLNEQQAAVKIFNLQSNFANTKLADIKQRRSVLNKEDKAGLQTLKAEEMKVLSEMSNARKTLFNKQIGESKRFQEIAKRNFESQVILGNANLEQQAVGELQVTKKVVADQIKLIKSRLKELPKAATEQRQELKIRQTELLASIAKAEENTFNVRINLQKEKFTNLEAIQKSFFERGVIDNVVHSQLLADIKIKEAQAELSLVRERQTQINSTNKEALLKLQAQEEAALTKISNARKNVFKAELDDINKYLQQRIELLSSDRAKGKISVSEFNIAKLAETETLLKEELKLIKKRRKEISSADLDTQRELEVQEAKIYKRRLDAQKQFLDEQIKSINKQQSKAKDLISFSAKQREIELLKLENSGLINRDEVEDKKLSATKERITQELQLEEDKLDKLQVLNTFGNSQLESDRNTKLRQSQLKIADLQIQLLRQERQEQELLVKAIDRVIQAIANKGKVAELELSKELKLVDAVSKSLETQNKILEAQRTLSTAKESYLNAELKVLQETAKSEREKKDLAEIAANLKLQAVKQQIEFDRKALSIQLQQTQAAQKRLEVENAIALIKNRADIARSEANEAKLKVKPGALPEEVEAARIDTVSAKLEREALLEQRRVLTEQRGINQELAKLRQQEFKFTSQAQETNAQLEAAQAIRPSGERKEKLQELRDRAQERIFGVSQRENNVGFYQRYDGLLRNNRGYTTTPLQDYFANQVRDNLSVNPPQIKVPETQPLQQLVDSTDKFDAAVDKLIKMTAERLKSPIQQQNQINNYFQPGEQQQAAQDTTQAIRKEMLDLAKGLK